MKDGGQAKAGDDNGSQHPARFVTHLFAAERRHGTLVRLDKALGAGVVPACSLKWR